ncbi:MAG: GFA family protein [Alphaproteobacteria bacterium]|nr:GFA family protein [Alphaproteobacteria bacterium]
MSDIKADCKTGGCLCGSVRYELTGEPMTTMICNCTICQRSSGSALSTIALVARDALKIEGELKGYEYAGDSGNKLEINFCPNCGSPIILNIRRMPDVVSIKVGSFDDTSWFKPKVSIWADSAQSWVPEIADCQAFGKNGQ